MNRNRYIRAMIRVALILLIVAQALAAQAGVAGVSCTHRALIPHADTPNMQTKAAFNEKAGDTNEREHARCCCDVIGTCSATAISARQSATTGHVLNPVHRVHYAGAATDRGFALLPYRPPSAAA